MVINVLLYGSPLAMMRTVIRTRSVKFMPLPMSLLTFVICILWRDLASPEALEALGYRKPKRRRGAQAIFIEDVTVGVPNVLGILLGVSATF